VVTGLIGERPAEAVRSLSIHAHDRRKAILLWDKDRLDE
jgi:hypothetical protein